MRKGAAAEGLQPCTYPQFFVEVPDVWHSTSSASSAAAGSGTSDGSGSTTSASCPAAKATAPAALLTLCSSSGSLILPAPNAGVMYCASLRSYGLRDSAAAGQALAAILSAASQHWAQSQPGTAATVHVSMYGMARKLLAYISRSWVWRYGADGCALDAVGAAVRRVLLPELPEPHATAVAALTHTTLSSQTRTAAPASSHAPDRAHSTQSSASGGHGTLHWLPFSTKQLKRALMTELQQAKSAALSPSSHQTAGPRAAALIATISLDPEKLTGICCMVHTALQLHGGCLVVGPPGCGKTTAWQQMLKAYHRLSSSSCAVPSCVLYPSVLASALEWSEHVSHRPSRTVRGSNSNDDSSGIGSNNSSSLTRQAVMQAVVQQWRTTWGIGTPVVPAAGEQTSSTSAAAAAAAVTGVVSAAPKHQLLVLDGALGPEPHVLDLMQLLADGRLQQRMPGSTAFLWETDTLAAASPALLATAAVVHVPEPLHVLELQVQQLLAAAYMLPARGTPASNPTTAAAAAAAAAPATPAAPATATGGRQLLATPCADVQHSTGSSDNGRKLSNKAGAPGISPSEAAISQSLLKSLVALLTNALEGHSVITGTGPVNTPAAAHTLARSVSAVVAGLWHCSADCVRSAAPERLAVRSLAFAAMWVLAGACSSSQQCQQLEARLQAAFAAAGFGQHMPPRLLSVRLCPESGVWVPWHQELAELQRGLVCAISMPAGTSSDHSSSHSSTRGKQVGAGAGMCCYYDYNPWSSNSSGSSSSDISSLYVASERSLALQCLAYTWQHAGLHPLVMGPPSCGKATALRHLLGRAATSGTSRVSSSTSGNGGAIQQEEEERMACASSSDVMRLGLTAATPAVCLWDALRRGLQCTRPGIMAPVGCVGPAAAGSAAGHVLLLVEDLHAPLQQQQQHQQQHGPQPDACRPAPSHEALRQLLDSSTWDDLATAQRCAGPQAASTEMCKYASLWCLHVRLIVLLPA